MTDERTEHPPTSTVTRMAPGEAETLDAVQGWAITDSGPHTSATREVDLLFVHGMASSATIWSAQWRARFADAGYRSWTITLPGRKGGGSLATNPGVLDRVIGQAMQGQAETALDTLLHGLPGMPILDGPSLDDFTDAVEDALARIGRPTVIVAHSLGGAAVQNMMRRGVNPAGVVLMGSVPPYGLWRASMEMAWTNPDLYVALSEFALAGLTPASTPIMRANLFPNGISNDDFAALLPELTDESLRAMTQALGMPPFAPMPGPRGNVLVLGGGRDRFVPLTDTWGTAAYYGTMPVILPEAGHLLMMGDAAEPASREILSFLEDLTL